MRQTLASVRNAMIARVVREEVKAFFHGARFRRCASCGEKFVPRQRWHFFCEPGCRRYWYRGQFRPRKED